jgi:AraC-like DNA-binding protein
MAEKSTDGSGAERIDQTFNEVCHDDGEEVGMVPIPRARAFEVAEAVGDWERHNAEALIELACRVPDERRFRAREVNLQLEHVRLALVSGTAHTVLRDEALVASRPADAIAVYATLKGDTSRVLRPGHVLVWDVDRPLQRRFTHGLQELAVKVPRASFTELTGTTGIAAPRVLDVAADAHARALVKLAARAMRSRAPLPADEQAVLELVSVVSAERRAGLPAAHRAAARAYIDDHLADALLSAADVASGAGVSERHLSRLFAEADSSVPRYILARRLDLAYSMLSQAPGRNTRTADVAARCGFTSMSHFSRAFSRRFGVAAGEIRREQAQRDSNQGTNHDSKPDTKQDSKSDSKPREVAVTAAAPRSG